jgi:hypothetical protein
MTAAFTQGNPALRDLEIYMPSGTRGRSSGLLHDIEQFLLFFLRLRLLYLCAKLIVSKQSVIQHAKTLTVLGLDARGAVQNRYNNADLAEILER